MTARSHVTGIDGHKTIKVNTSSTRTLDEVAEQCVDIAKVGFVTKPASCSAKARSRLW